MMLPDLSRGTILRRYKRFLADVDLDDGRSVTAHCPNTGSMKTCWEPGVPVELSFTDAPHRKLPWTLERVDMGAGWVGVNTHRVNAVIAEAAAHGLLPGFETMRDVNREVPVAAPDNERARLDLLLKGSDAPVYVEVKNATLLEGDLVRFPDAVSARASKHMQVLRGLVAAGHRALILFAVNRPEGAAMAPADDIDPDYGKALRAAVADGVEVLALRLDHDRCSIQVGAALPLAL